VETGKGQAKSPWMAAIGLYLMGYYGVARSEVYAIGQDRATANVLFKDAVAMCRAPIPGGGERETLEAEGEVVVRGIGDNAWKIEHPETSSKFQSLANSDAISGPRPTAVLADEIHEMKSGDAIETWRRAIAKMPGDALMILGTNTPASTQIVGTEYSEHYQRVLRSDVVADDAFAFIARVDTSDRETVFENEACWAKALPALGVTFPISNIRDEVATAKVLLSTAFSVKRLYFGIPIGSASFWIREDAWAAVQRPVDPAKYKGRKVWLSLDLSDKNDLTALSGAWQAGENPKAPAARLAIKTWYWTTKSGLAERALADNAKYIEWDADPKVDFTAVPGAVIDKTFVAMQVKTLCATHNVQFLAFDSAKMGDFIAACEQIGFPVWRYKGPKEPKGRGLMLVSHAQGKKIVFEEKALNMPRSIEKLEDRILADTIDIDDSPVTYMCAGNAILDADGQGNRAFDKVRSRGRIDGLVTIAMSTGAADNELEEGPNLNDFLKRPVMVGVRR
jgi:phage terminase large subunit-like protein